LQGIDHVKNDIKEILEMLLGSDRFASKGAKVPRGVLLEGPPGTGKTFLARAMATEAGIPFFSANGAEFVQVRLAIFQHVPCETAAWLLYSMPPDLLAVTLSALPKHSCSR
jgi:predicted ATPase